MLKLLSVKKLSIFILVSLFTISFSGNSLLAQDSKSLDINQRLDALVLKYNILLSENQINEVILSCPLKQQKIASTQSQIDKSVSLRMQIYTEMINQISAIEHRVMRQGADASELDMLIGRIQILVDELTEAAADYGLVADDSRLIDCQNNPQRFVASIKELQAIHYRIVSISDEIISVIKDSPKTTFIPLANRLSI